MATRDLSKGASWATVPGSRDRLGEILLESGLLSNVEVRRILDRQCKLRWSLLVTLVPVLMAGCSGGGANLVAAPVPGPVATPVAVPALRSNASSVTETAAPNEPIPVESSSQVVSAGPVTGDVGPTGNITVTVSFPEQIVAPNASVQRLRLVPTAGASADQVRSPQMTAPGTDKKEN